MQESFIQMLPPDLLQRAQNRLGWIKREREIVLQLAELFAAAGRHAISARLKGCYSFVRVEIIRENLLALPYYRCDIRVCPFYSRRRRSQIANYYEPYIKKLADEGHRLQYLTLTTPNVTFLDRSELKRLWLCWRKLRKQTLFKGCRATLAFMETKPGIKGWHLHLHIILIGGSTIAEDAISAAWYLLTKDSYIVNIKPLDASGIARCIRYSSKFIPVDNAEDLCQMYDATHGFNLVCPTGRLYNVKKSFGDKINVSRKKTGRTLRDIQVIGEVDMDSPALKQLLQMQSRM